MRIVLLLIIFTGCSWPAGEQGMRVGVLNGPGGLSLVKMINAASSEAEDPGVRYIVRNDPSLIVAMMMSEELDVALVPLTTGALLYNKGLPYQLAGVPVWGSLYLVGRDTSIARISDLRGDTVYLMARNMTPDVVFRHLLRANGLEPRMDVALDYTFPTPTELAAALWSDRVPMGLVSEPMVSQILKDNPSLHVLLDVAALWNDLYTGDPALAQTAVMVHFDWVRKHPGQFEQWLDHLDGSIEWVVRHPDQATQLAVEHGIVRDAEVAMGAIERCRIEFKSTPAVNQEVLKYLSVLHGVNPRIIGNTIPNEDFFYSK